MSDGRKKLNHYLLVFDHRSGKLIDSPQEFTDTDLATTAYAQVERRYQKDDLVEVVLIGSDSLDTVRETHSNYFDGSVALIRVLERLVGSGAQ